MEEFAIDLHSAAVATLDRSQLSLRWLLASV